MIVVPCLGIDEQVLASVFDGLLDGKGHLFGLAVANADRIIPVADRYQSGERETPAALDHLGHPVDMDHALLKVKRICLYLRQSATPLSIKSPGRPGGHHPPEL